MRRDGKTSDGKDPFGGIHPDPRKREVIPPSLPRRLERGERHTSSELRPIRFSVTPFTRVQLGVKGEEGLAECGCGSEVWMRERGVNAGARCGCGSEV